MSTRVVLMTDSDDDPLDSVRRAVQFADAMIADGAIVTVTGDLSLSIRFPDHPTLVDKEQSLSAPSGERG